MRPYFFMKENLSFRNRGPRAFTIAENVAAILILAIAACACVAIVANRHTNHDRTTAFSGAPAAIDAFAWYFDNRADVAATNAAVAADTAFVACEIAGDGGAVWHVMNAKELTDMKGVTGAVYVAQLSNAKLYENSSAVEFDVSLGWIAPGVGQESSADIASRLDKPAPICKYRAIVLRR
jgi:hypothetical protein